MELEGDVAAQQIMMITQTLVSELRPARIKTPLPVDEHVAIVIAVQRAALRGFNLGMQITLDACTAAVAAGKPLPTIEIATAPEYDGWADTFGTSGGEDE